MSINRRSVQAGSAATIGWLAGGILMRRGEIVDMGPACKVLVDPTLACARELNSAAPHFHSRLKASIAPSAAIGIERITP